MWWSPERGLLAFTLQSDSELESRTHYVFFQAQLTSSRRSVTKFSISCFPAAWLNLWNVFTVISGRHITHSFALSLPPSLSRMMLRRYCSGSRALRSGRELLTRAGVSFLLVSLFFKHFVYKRWRQLFTPRKPSDDSSLMFCDFFFLLLLLTPQCGRRRAVLL